MFIQKLQTKMIHICPDCDKDLIFCNGKMKIPYFRHAVTEYNPCTYYDKPNESQIHKDSKMYFNGS